MAPGRLPRCTSPGALSARPWRDLGVGIGAPPRACDEREREREREKERERERERERGNKSERAGGR